MIVSDLKKSVLKSIFTGGSDTNNVNDTNANILIDEITAKQQELIKLKKIKVGKFNNKINKDELPKIPSNWEYVKIGSIAKLVTKQTGFDYSKNIKPTLIKEHLDNYIPLIQTKDFKDKNFNFDTTYYAPESLTKRFPNITLNQKALLLSIVGASIGNVGLYLDTKVCLLGGAIAKIDLVDDRLYEYLYLYLKSPLGYEQIMKNYKSTAQGTITVEDVRNIIVPIPPIEEQKRIVNKIEKLFTKMDEIEIIEKELEAIKIKFPIDFKKSILIDAVTGKLSHQNKDEIVTIKNVDLINKEGIPNNWLCIKAKNLLNITTGRKDANYGSEDGQYLFYTCANEPIKSPTYSFEGENLILPGNGANVGVTIYVNDKFEAYQRTYVVNSKYDNSIINLKYIYYFFQAYWNDFNKDKMFGSAIPYIKLGNLENFEINIPPIEEQKRIVNKIEQILPLCDDITGLVSEV